MEHAEPIHESVMLDEVVHWLQPRPGQIIVDGTLGGGGHTRALAERVAPDGFVLALDRDPHAIARAEMSLAGLCVQLVGASFRELAEVLDQLNIKQVDGVLFDLGLSSDQLAEHERGFSFDSSGPLDLRFDPESGEPAWRLLEKLNERQLADLIYRFGEERHSRRIARRILEQQSREPIRTARQLAEVVRRSVPRSRDTQRIDPATRTFQALRIVVNDELEALPEGLRHAASYLAPDARIAVISFHSLEDRIVKEAYRDDPRLEVLTKKPLRASPAEVARNPRARSAKMRVARRTVSPQ
jgi:16S rRNA (cytosine1402-N4)-methyltransferase